MLEISLSQCVHTSIFLSDELTKDVMAYIQALREVGGTINTVIVIFSAMGMTRQKDRSSLACNGGYITLDIILYY